MSKKKDTVKTPEEDFLTQEAKEEAAQAPAYTLDIPEDEIWTYQIDGLQSPRVGKPIQHFTRKKVIVVLILVVAISLAIFFTLRTVHSETYRYSTLEDGTYELVKFSNSGSITSLTIENADDDPAKPISTLHEFAFNCDEKITDVTIGKSVVSIEPTSFYSCWALQNIKVDKDNPAFCDVDGVLYTKDMTKVICYPIDHDKYLREKCGYTDLKDDEGKPMEELWGPTETYDEAFFEKYNADVRTYVLPSTVTVIGATAFNYANLTDLYLPEGLAEIETMAFFKSTSLRSIYTYTPAAAKNDAVPDAKNLQGTYLSLPDGLTTIGSDAFTGDQALSYLFIPASVTSIGHHAFWDTCYKADGMLKGITEIHTALGQEAFEAQVQTGDQWRPQNTAGLFPKNIPVEYAAARAE